MCVYGLVLKTSKVFKFIVAMEVSDVESPVLKCSIHFFLTDIVLDSPLLLRACTDLRYILLDFVCRNGFHLQKNPWIFPHFGGAWPREV